MSKHAVVLPMLKCSPRCGHWQQRLVFYEKLVACSESPLIERCIQFTIVNRES